MSGRDTDDFVPSTPEGGEDDDSGESRSGSVWEDCAVAAGEERPPGARIELDATIVALPADITAPTDDIFGRSERPEAPDGFHYALDPLTGRTRLTADPSGRAVPDIARYDPAQDIINRRGWSYGVDPNTGMVGPVPNARPDIYIRQPYEDRGWHYALDPRTGAIRAYPNLNRHYSVLESMRR